MNLIKLNTPALVKEYFGKYEFVAVPEDYKVVLEDGTRLFPKKGESLQLKDGVVSLKEEFKKEEPKEPVTKKKKEK